ncbi:hypothetical protein D3C80_1922090 [compost metagenome]
MVRIPVNQLDLNVFIFFEQLGKMLRCYDTTITAAQNDYFFQEIHLLCLGW